MKSCCESKSDEITALNAKHRNVLVIVFWVNAVMFFVEFASGIIARSTALLGDSLDMFGDALVYAVSLYVIGKSGLWLARAAYFKGIIMALLGSAVLFEAIYKLGADIVPHGEAITIMGIVALVANGYCLYLLTRHKDDNINLRSTWICSRNDIIANVAVIFAGLSVGFSGSKYPDIIVGLGIAFLFLRSSLGIILDARKELRV